MLLRLALGPKLYCLNTGKSFARFAVRTKFIVPPLRLNRNYSYEYHVVATRRVSIGTEAIYSHVVEEANSARARRVRVVSVHIIELLRFVAKPLNR